MKRWIAAVLALLAGSASAEDAPEFKTLKEARAAVLAVRAKALKRLEADALLIPECFFEAEAKRRGAYRAWLDKRWGDATAGYRAAWTLYGKPMESTKEKHAALLAMRQKKPPEPRLRFSQRKAIHFALQWLARHQDPLGRWDCAGFMKHDPDGDRCDGGGRKEYDVGVTALAVLAFLEAGFGDRDNHYALEVYRGLQWLRTQQDHKGLFGSSEPVHNIYSHAITTVALAKTYALTKDKRYEPALNGALEYILKARNPGKGWRYDPAGGENDTSATTWCYRALKAGMDAGMALELAKASKGSRTWLDSVTLPDGRVEYVRRFGVARPDGLRLKFPEDRSRAMTAAGTVLRLLLSGENYDRKLVERSLDRCLERPPTWNISDGSIDMYYWYYGTLAVQVDKKRARTWVKPLHKALFAHQHRKGARAGSWDPIGVWGADGGRVYSTAILALTLLHAG